MVGPAPCPKGVWPLVYLRGLEVQLVAVGDTALDCVLLQDKVRGADRKGHKWCRGRQGGRAWQQVVTEETGQWGAPQGVWIL
jgi:hypothetical protein